MFTDNELVTAGIKIASIWGAEYISHEVKPNEAVVTFFCVEHGEKFYASVSFDDVREELGLDSERASVSKEKQSIGTSEDEIDLQEAHLHDTAMSAAEEIFMNQYPQIFNYVDLEAYTMGDCLLNSKIPFGTGNYPHEIAFGSSEHFGKYETLIKTFEQLYKQIRTQHENQLQNMKESDSMSKYEISARVNPLHDQSGPVKAMAHGVVYIMCRKISLGKVVS